MPSHMQAAVSADQEYPIAKRRSPAASVQPLLRLQRRASMRHHRRVGMPSGWDDSSDIFVRASAMQSASSNDEAYLLC